MIFSFVIQIRQLSKYTLSLFLLGCIFVSPVLYADDSEYEFDTSFLRGANASNINLDYFTNAGGTLPGVYYSTIYINQVELYDINIQIKSREDKTTYACLSSDIVRAIRFNYERIPKDVADKINDYDGCLDMEMAFPETQVKYNSNETRLDISIPQVYQKTLARGEIDESQWETGVTAGILNYSISGYNSVSNGQENQSLYASLNTGFNFGSWYFRQNGNVTWSEEKGAEYTSLNAYVQRDITPIKGRITIGQTNTQGQLFNSVPFTGAQIASDDRMLPTSQRGYAPQIRGIAKTSARVSVYQGDMQIYETTVTPGEFLINDLYPTGYGGDLDVVIRESDGSEQRFSVPYESMAQMIRPGFHRYSLTAGLYRNDSLSEEPILVEGTYQLGITNALTAYGGIQGNADYQAVQAGVAVGTEIGAFSADVTQSNASFDEGYESKSGQSFQLRYSKNFTETGSDLSLATFRHATEDYMDYRSAMEMRDDIKNGNRLDNISGTKNRLLITANQDLPDGWGDFYGSATIEDYWDQEGYSKQFQLGYNNSFGSVSWGLMVSRTEGLNDQDNTNYSVNMSLPLAGSEYSKRPQLRITLNQDDHGNARQQANVSGTLGDYNQFNYGLTVSNSDRKDSTSADVNVGYSGSLAKLSASYSVGKDYHSETVGISGSMVAHSGGVTLSPYSGSTYAIIEAKGAEGAKIAGYPGVEVDSNGYAILPYLSPYQMNEIFIDAVSSKKDIELITSTRKIVPIDKAVVLVKFETKRGQSMLINATINGQPITFGAIVSDERDYIVGSVGQAGQIYARVEDPRGTLTVAWSDNPNDQCTLDYDIDPEIQSMQQFDAECILVAPE